MSSQRRGTVRAQLRIGAHHSASVMAAVAVILIAAFFTIDSILARDAIYTLIPLLSAIVIVVTTLRHRLLPLAAWLVLAAGCLFFAAGNAVYLFYQAVLDQTPPFPSAADLFFLAFTVMPALGLALLTRAAAARDANLLIDSLVAGVGAGLIAWVSVIEPYLERERSSPSETVLGVLYAIGFVAVVTILMRAVVAIRSPTSAVLLIEVALTGQAVGFFGYSVLSLHGTYYTGHPIDVPILASAAAFGIAAWLERSEAPSGSDATGARARGLSLPTAGLYLVSLMMGPVALAIDPTAREPIENLVLLVGTALVGVLVLARLRNLVTAVEEGKAAITREEERYRTLVEGLPGAVYVANAGEAGGWDYVSPQIEQLLGYPPEAWIEDPGLWISRVEPDAREAVLRDEATFLREGSDASDGTFLEYRMRHRDGRVRWVRDRARLLPGRRDVFQGVLVDITDQREAEEKLRRSDRRRGAILDAALDAIISLKSDGEVVEWNTTAERMFGFSAENAVGKNITDLIVPPSPPGAARSALAQALAGDGATIGERIEVTAVNAAGHEFPVELSLNQVAISGSRLLVAVTRDLRDVRQREAERDELQHRLEATQRLESVGQLAGGIAHDFNNLLSVILTYASFVLESVDPGNPAYADLEEIERAAKKAADLTRQLLLFSRKESVRLELVELAPILADLDRLLRRTMPEDVELDFLVGDELPPVQIDRSQLEQVVVNLITNARDALPKGGRIVIDAQTALGSDEAAAPEEAASRRAGVMLSVSDNGTGIEPEVLQHIFEPFFTTKGRTHGTGLGLATVYGIVTRFNGSITVDSEPGIGTTFRVYLPGADRADAVEPSAATTPTVAPGLPARILLVEDEPALLRIATRVLTGVGYAVVAHADPRQAVAAVQAGAEFDLLVTDVVMPHLSGRQVAEQTGLATLYMSGYDDQIVAERGFVHGHARLLQKPFTPQDLVQAVSDTMSQGGKAARGS